MEQGALGSEDDIFTISGPHHLIHVHWTNLYDITSVLASLVKGVYTKEGDRQKDLIGTPDSQAEPWWEFFHFSLKELVYDGVSIIAAIFEYNDQNTHHSGIPPRYVFAFRGTILHRETWFRDGLLDLRSTYNLLHGERMTKIIEKIETLVTTHGHEAVWLAGHSLGGGMALLAGKTLARSGYPLETYVFNPATALISMKLLKSKRLKFVVRAAGTITRAGIVKAFGYDKGEEAESFMRLAAWRPHLLVHPTDPICSEYISYFNDRNKMSVMGLPVNLGTRFTNSNPFSSGGGEKGLSSEPLHILPSAYLMTNTTILPKRPRTQGVLRDLRERMRFERRRKAHALRQWWDLKSIVVCELFQLVDSTSSSDSSPTSSSDSSQ